MASSPNITPIVAPRVPFLDPRTGLISREWYRFLLNLVTRISTDELVLDDLLQVPDAYSAVADLAAALAMALQEVETVPDSSSALASLSALLTTALDGLQKAPVPASVDQLAVLQNQIDALSLAPSPTGATGNFVPNGTQIGATAQAHGVNSLANGTNALAVGAFSNATGNSAVAVGRSAIANGISAVAMGNLSSATGNASTALGDVAVANGIAAVAVGAFANAAGFAAVAVGNAVANGVQATAIGGGANASFANSTAVGTLAATTANNQVMLGTSAETVVVPGALSVAGGASLLATAASLTNNAGAALATLTNGPTVGNPTLWFSINDNGTTRYIPAW